MSITFKTYKQGDIYIEARWDKCLPHFHCIVCEKRADGLYHTTKDLTYGTKEEAMRSFCRQVAKAKKGEIQ